MGIFLLIKNQSVTVCSSQRLNRPRVPKDYELNIFHFHGNTTGSIVVHRNMKKKNIAFNTMLHWKNEVYKDI